MIKFVRGVEGRGQSAAFVSDGGGIVDMRMGLLV